MLCSIGALGAFVPKEKKKAELPGTVFFRPHLYMDAVPIDNIGYREFLYATKLYHKECLIAYANAIKSQVSVDGQKTYLEQNCYRNQVDSSIIPPLRLIPRSYLNFVGDDSTVIEDYDLYLSHPAYSSYPVATCTRQQAMDFCRWRTAMVKILFYVGYTDAERPIKAYENFEYRLPYHHELAAFANEYRVQGKFYKSAEPDTAGIPEYTPYAAKQSKRKASFSNIYEYTQSEDSLFYVKETDAGLAFYHQTDTVQMGERYTGFRCVCEIKP